MIWLVFASLIWSFSPGFIKGLSTHMDPFVLGVLRMAIAFVASMFFLRERHSVAVADRRLWFKVGFIQLGVMYAPYLWSFSFLKAHEAVLFTMTSPIFVAILSMLRSRVWQGRVFNAAVLAMAGGLVVAWKQTESQNLFIGALLVQLSNILFVYGQSLISGRPQSSWREYRLTLPFYFFGAFVGSFVCLLLSLPWRGIPSVTLQYQDAFVLLWLGVVASGLGFWLWNRGVMLVTAGQLAVATDIKLPISIAVSLIVFGEQADLVRLSIGAGLISYAAYVAKPK